MAMMRETASMVLLIMMSSPHGGRIFWVVARRPHQNMIIAKIGPEEALWLGIS
jgi:hypothetical protein